MMRRGILIAFASSALLFTGCEELENLCGISADDLGFTEEYNKHLGAAIYVYQQADRALRDTDLDVNDTAEIDGAICTKTADSLIVDFGNGTIGQDNVTRYGSYRMALIGNYMNLGGKASLALKNYRNGDDLYTGDFIIENTIPSGSTSPRYDISVASFAVDSFELNANMVADWVAGSGTPSITDDEFNLSGGASLSNTSSLDAYNGSIVTPLLISTGCEYSFISGELTLIPTNTELPSVAIDFIDADNCENLFQATVSCNGGNFTTTLPIK